IFNLLYTERGRPVISQRLRTLVLELLRGSSASFTAAANFSSIGVERSSRTAFNEARFAANFIARVMRRLFFSTALFFAMGTSGASTIMPEMGNLGHEEAHAPHHQFELLYTQ